MCCLFLLELFLIITDPSLDVPFKTNGPNLQFLLFHGFASRNPLVEITRQPLEDAAEAAEEATSG